MGTTLDCPHVFRRVLTMLRCLLAALVLSLSMPAFAAITLTEEDFRLYCGYLERWRSPMCKN